MLVIYTVKIKNNESFSNNTMNLYGENPKDNINNIYFLDINSSINILKNDEDDYFKSFYKSDYIARNIENLEEYNDYINESVSSFTLKEKYKLINCINIADNTIKNIYFDWFNGIKCSKIPWKIICIKGKLYEKGLPHTRSNYIIISSEDVNNYSNHKLIKTLIHEKVHIYQKIFNNDINIYITENKFQKIKIRDELDGIRANPDINNWIYKDKDGNVYRAEYNSKNPKSIADITYKPIHSQSYEHPYERMAIFIESLYK
jgi:hypothetical protein